MARLLNIGCGNVVKTAKIVSIITPDSAPAKSLIQKAKEEDRIDDATQGRRTRGIILVDGNKVILSALQPDTLAGRFNGRENETED